MAFLYRLVRIVALIFYLPAPWIIAVCAKRGGDGWSKTARVAKVTRLWAGGLAAILGMKLTVHRTGKTAPEGGLIVANHTSYLDILVAGSVFPVRFMPKSEIRSWPLLGSYLGTSRPIWVDRTSPSKAGKVAAEMVETMKHGIPLIVYPEGTTGDGTTLKEFKSTAFEAAILAGGATPVLPMLTIYRNREMNLAWYGDMTLMPHLWRVLGLRRIVIDVYLLSPVWPEPGEDRKKMALRVRELMLDEYRKRRGENDGVRE